MLELVVLERRRRKVRRDFAAARQQCLQCRRVRHVDGQVIELAPIRITKRLRRRQLQCNRLRGYLHARDRNAVARTRVRTGKCPATQFRIRGERRDGHPREIG